MRLVGEWVVVRGWKGKVEEEEVVVGVLLFYRRGKEGFVCGLDFFYCVLRALCMRVGLWYCVLRALCMRVGLWYCVLRA